MKLFYKEFSIHLRSVSTVVGKFFNDLPEGGRFHCNLSRAYNTESYLSRLGHWSEPWETNVMPGWEMPQDDINFNLTFEEVTDLRALDVKKFINSTNKECVVFYSGGIDSTVVLSSLIKNLTPTELQKITVSLSADSIIENPYFYRDYILGKFKIIDSSKNLYTDLKNKNMCCITGDLGDFIFGTELGVKMYPQMKFLESQLPSDIKRDFSKLYYNVSNGDVHYSNYKDLLIFYFNLGLSKGVNRLSSMSFLPKSLQAYTSQDSQFGELLYEKINNNIKSINAPVYSLHDFYWWSMFNMRFIWGGVRPSMNYSTEDNVKEFLDGSLINWFASNQYQQWSMANNNNGEKIKGTSQSSYKWAAKKYIHNFDKNDFYLFNKIKMPSMPVIVKRSWRTNFENFDYKWAIDDQYNVLKIDQPGVNNFIETGLMNYKVDWS